MGKKEEEMKWMFWKDYTDKPEKPYFSLDDMLEFKELTVYLKEGGSHSRKIKWHPTYGSDCYYLSDSCIHLDEYKLIIPLTSVNEIVIRDIINEQ